MRSEVPPKAICPHCGSEFDYEELCRFCGKLVDGDIPVQKVPLNHFLGTLFSRLKGKGFDGVDENEFTDIDASDDPGLAHLPGNSYHYIWLANHEKD